MKLWLQWVFLIVGVTLSTVSIRMWPKINEINSRLAEVQEFDLANKEDVFAIIFFKPFHYLISILFLIFFVFILSSLVRKIIYECKVAYLFRVIPYESLILSVFVLLMYIRVLLFFPYLVLVLTIVMFTYDFISYIPKSQKEAVYMKEG
jgi:hypothetical protein